MGQAFPIARIVDPASMADEVMCFLPATQAELLKLLRARFPDHPLSVRIAALDFVMRRRGHTGAAYSPR